MTFDYPGAETVAQALLTEFGAPGTLHARTAGGEAHNPTFSENDQAITCAVLDYKKKEIDGTLIQQNDKKILISTEGLSAKPDTSHQITANGLRHEIMDVAELAPAGHTVMYVVQARI